MATLVLSTNSVADGALSKTFTVTEPQFAAWVAALKVYFSTLGQPGLTDAQAQLAWANFVFSQCVQMTQNNQQLIAAATITPIASST